jgi:DNA-binding response OmpR family regulator
MADRADLLDIIMPMVEEVGLEELSTKTWHDLVSEVRSDPLGQWFLSRGQRRLWATRLDSTLQEPAHTYLMSRADILPTATDRNQLRIDLNQAIVYSSRGAVFLTPTEARLLACLARQPGVTVARGILSDIISQDHTGAVWTDPKHHIRNLRIKLNDDPSHPAIILSRRGLGYYLDKSMKGQVIW